MLDSAHVVRVHNFATTPTRRDNRATHKQSPQGRSDKQLSAYHKRDTASQIGTTFTTSANSSSVLVSRCLNHTCTRALLSMTAHIPGAFPECHERLRLLGLLHIKVCASHI